MPTRTRGFSRCEIQRSGGRHIRIDRREIPAYQVQFLNFTAVALRGAIAARLTTRFFGLTVYEIVCFSAGCIGTRRPNVNSSPRQRVGWETYRLESRRLGRRFLRLEAISKHPARDRSRAPRVVEGIRNLHFLVSE